MDRDLYDELNLPSPKLLLYMVFYHSNRQYIQTRGDYAIKSSLIRCFLKQHSFLKLQSSEHVLIGFLWQKHTANSLMIGVLALRPEFRLGLSLTPLFQHFWPCAEGKHLGGGGWAEQSCSLHNSQEAERDNETKRPELKKTFQEHT